MNEFREGLYKAIQTYLKMLPLVIIPVAGIFLLVTLAPYYSVVRGTKVFEEPYSRKGKKLALSFSILISSIVSGLLLLIAKLLTPVLILGSQEIGIIALVYISFIFFSLLGAKEE